MEMIRSPFVRRNKSLMKGIIFMWGENVHIGIDNFVLKEYIEHMNNYSYV